MNVGDESSMNANVFTKSSGPRSSFIIEKSTKRLSKNVETKNVEK